MPSLNFDSAQLGFLNARNAFPRRCLSRGEGGKGKERDLHGKKTFRNGGTPRAWGETRVYLVPRMRAFVERCLSDGALHPLGNFSNHFSVLRVASGHRPPQHRVISPRRAHVVDPPDRERLLIISWCRSRAVRARKSIDSHRQRGHQSCSPTDRSGFKRVRHAATANG